MENFQEVDVQKAEELIGQGDITIVDIRDPAAFEEGHIENAQSVNDANIEEFVNQADKSRPVLCYCYMGFSSKNAAQYFKDQGFKTVYSIIGGYTQWQKAHEASGESS